MKKHIFSDLKKDIAPCLIEKVEDVIYTHDYTIKSACFTENSGKVYLKEPNGIFVIKATMYSDNYKKNVTKKIRRYIGQCGKPQPCIKINTRIFNKYTRGEIEIGSIKKLVIEYITDDKVNEEKRVTKTLDEVVYFERKQRNNLETCSTEEEPFEQKFESSVYLINQNECD